MLDDAKKYLRKVMTALADDIERGTPIVCLEPSCASVFRDELRNLFPSDKTAEKLGKQVVLFPDFLESAGYRPATLDFAPRKQTHKEKDRYPPKALVHGHCHHKSLWSMTPEQKLLSAAGIAPEVLESGCCGLAGSFGYEAEHYDISMQIGEIVLLPRVRSAAADQLIVADGFSCRQQIAHGTERHALHTAEVLQMALHSKSKPLPSPRGDSYVEKGHIQPHKRVPVLALLSLVGLAAGLLYLSKHRAGRS